MAAYKTTFEVSSPNVQYSDEFITSKYVYESTRVVTSDDGKTVATPVAAEYAFKTERRVPRVGMMIVGLGGNNGTTVTAGVIANREGISWRTRKGIQEPNYLGSLTQASTLRLGTDERGNDVYIPFTKMLPMVSPNDLVIGGWDINNMNLADAMDRAQVLEPDLQRQLYPIMKEMVPLPSIYFPHFIAANQAERANNVLEGSHEDLVEHIRKDMRNFKAANGLDKVIVLWSANTERFADVRVGLNDTAASLMASIKSNDPEVSPSTLFAVACILEGVPYINGSPQNTFVPGVIELAEAHKVHIAGDDFKSGQTKMKSVLVDFLISAGIKPESVVSYNHLGNNDGRNLSAPAQFRSKEISKSSVVDDMVASNPIMYQEGEHPDHTVVIKYVPWVGDSKRALDEYSSSIFLGGQNTITMANVCEDSLLAAPLMLDLVILMELMTRMSYKAPGDSEFQSFNVIASILSYLLKAPLVPQGTPVINALFRQRMSIENLMRVATGLPIDSFLMLEQKTVPSRLYPDARPAGPSQ